MPYEIYRVPENNQTINSGSTLEYPLIIQVNLVKIEIMLEFPSLLRKKQLLWSIFYQGDLKTCDKWIFKSGA